MVATVLCSIMIQNIYSGPVMFVITCFALNRLDFANQNMITKKGSLEKKRK